MTRERHFVQHPDGHVPSTTEGPKTDVQLQHLPPKSGLKRMSYPFSNLSTVVLATDIPVLPVEELRAESTSVTAILSSTTEYFVVFIDFVSLLHTRCTIQDQGTFPVLSTSMTWRQRGEDLTKGTRTYDALKKPEQQTTSPRIHFSFQVSIFCHISSILSSILVKYSFNLSTSWAVTTFEEKQTFTTLRFFAMKNARCSQLSDK